MEDMTFVANENGKNITFNIIKYFKNPNNNQDYIIYAEKGKDDIFASKYEIKNNELILNEITSDEEWDYVDKVLGEDNE